jgi:hemolysin activation/secretion protein
VRLEGSFAHFFSLNRTSSLKTSVTGGWFQSPDIFRNELFQIGGYRLLRGFDEESIYASGYAVAGIEYRYFMGANSYLFGFIDQGFATNKTLEVEPGNSYTGGGLGMAFETKAGIFNISFAAGKRGGEKLNLRQSKIHLGYVNYF